VTPSLATGDVLLSLACYIIVYAIIYAFGLFFIYRLLRDGPARDGAMAPATATPARPLAVAIHSPTGSSQ
jgi:cytochrome d ubiquinol oxidase subunit I